MASRARRLAGNAKRQPIHINDVANAVLTALDKTPPGGRYAIGGPDVLTQLNIIHKIQQALGKRHLAFDLPPIAASYLSKACGQRLWAQQLGRAAKDKHIKLDQALPQFQAQTSFDKALELTLLQMTALENEVGRP